MACTIYDAELYRKPINFQKLTEALKDSLTETQLKKCISMLLDCSIITIAHLDNNERVYTISAGSYAAIKKMYRNYWVTAKDHKYLNPLSNEFMVACEIFHHNHIKEDIWMQKLASKMQNQLARNTIARAKCALVDWKLIETTWITADSGKVRKLLQITRAGNDVIEELYYNFWKNYRDTTYDTVELE